MAWSEWEPSADDKKRGIGENDAVKKLVPDPTDMPDLIVLRGWLGRAPKTNLWRVYHDLELTRFTEVPADKIKWTIQDGLMTLVWVERSDALRAGRSGSLETEARFLRGTIADDADRTSERGGWDGQPDPTKCNRCSTYTPCGG